jgi:hypothetical protein
MSRLLASSAVLITGAAALIMLAVLQAFEHPAANPRAAAIGTSVRVGGIVYTSPDARPLDPRKPQDVVLMRGARAPRKRAGDIWYGAFVVATNDGSTRAAMARDILLRDTSGHWYRPVALPAANRFRYRPRTVAPGEQVPSPRAPAEADLAAQGGLLLYRIPRAAYENGPLEIRLRAAGERADLAVDHEGGGRALGPAVHRQSHDGGVIPRRT